MTNLYSILLTLHIATGSLALLTGTVNMFRQKGGEKHRKMGRLYVRCMMATGVSALVMAQLKPNPFLFIVGVFTIYLVGTANRYIQPAPKEPLLIDWVYTLGMFVFATIFMIWGAHSILHQESMGWVMLTFGGIGWYSVYKDFINYKGRNPERKHRLFTHIGRMIGGYTATLTAVLVVNGDRIPVDVPEFVLWLSPTLVLTPLSVYWIRQRK